MLYPNGRPSGSGVARLEVMEGQTWPTCIPRKTLDNVNDHTKKANDPVVG